MKRKFLKLIFLILIIKGYSQDYYSIVSEENYWSVVSCIQNNIMIGSTKTNHYKLEGDTTIQLYDYKKILVSNDSLLQKWEMIGFMREDEALKKVWMRNLEDSEGLIYDFDLELGKNVTIFNPYFNYTVTYQVTNLDSILIQTQYRNVYTLSFGELVHERWIEGIGSEYGIINSNWYLEGKTFSALNEVRELLCFANGEIEYINPKFHTCHKTSFTPLFTNQSIDTAYIDQEYSFQLTTTKIFDYDSVTFFISNLNNARFPNGVSLNQEKGLISGFPTETGSFEIFICILNNGYVTDYWQTVLEVRDKTSNSLVNLNRQLKVYPNPSSEIINIDCNVNDLCLEAIITDMNGRQKFSKDLNKDNNIINIKDWKDGAYFLTIYIRGTKEMVLVKKLIKK